MCGDGKCELVCGGCRASLEAETFLAAYERAREAEWGMLADGLLLCAGCVARVAKRAMMIAHAHLN